MTGETLSCQRRAGHASVKLRERGITIGSAQIFGFLFFPRVEGTPMRRRDFLTKATIALRRSGLRTGSQEPRPANCQNRAEKWRGVNLGGWLALRNGSRPACMPGCRPRMNTRSARALGKAKAAEHLKRHRETWVTAEDFDWLKARGINAVRIPVNYGVAEENPPFITAMDTLDWAFQTAKKHGIGVLLDLHGVPGSQNAWDHSGRQGTLGWHTSKENIDHSLRIVADLASRCKGYENLIGFELLNEPR